jgi:hypothetical protein
MPSIREACVSLWNDLNPPEPTARYLAKFFAVAVVLFAIAFLIGHV